MSFSNPEKVDIKDILGYPLTNINTILDSGGVSVIPFVSALDIALNNVADSDAETLIKALVTQIKSNRTAINSAKGRLKASAVGDITLNSKEIKQRWQEDLNEVTRLAKMLSVDIYYHPSQNSCNIPIRR